MGEWGLERDLSFTVSEVNFNLTKRPKMVRYTFKVCLTILGHYVLRYKNFYSNTLTRHVERLVIVSIKSHFSYCIFLSSYVG